MSALFAQASVKGPEINWEALSPAISLTAGACIVLLVGLARSAFIRRGVVSLLTLVTLGVTAGPLGWLFVLAPAGREFRDVVVGSCTGDADGRNRCSPIWTSMPESWAALSSTRSIHVPSHFFPE